MADEVTTEPSAEETSLSQKLVNGLQNYKTAQEKKVAALGLQNVISGQSMTMSDVTKFTSNPYVTTGIRKLRNNKTIAELRNKISNSRAVSMMSSLGMDKLLDFTGDAESPIERVWTFVDESGETAVPFDVYISMNVKNESKVVSMPVENGSFVSYNKTKSPIQINTSLAIKGKPDEIKSALTNIMDMVDDTAIISLITPDYEYKSMCITSCNYRRAAEDGIDMLIVDCALTEVREIELEYTNSKLSQKKSRGLQQSQPKSMVSYGRDKLKSMFS